MLKDKMIDSGWSKESIDTFSKEFGAITLKYFIDNNSCYPKAVEAKQLNDALIFIYQNYSKESFTVSRARLLARGMAKAAIGRLNKYKEG